MIDQTNDNRTWKVRFDALCLCAVLAELKTLVGAKVQKCASLGDQALVFELYLAGPRFLLIDWSAEGARLTLTQHRPPSSDTTPTCTEFRMRLVPSRLVAVEQVGQDRIAHLTFQSAERRFDLIAEIMGKHSNLILVGEDGRVACSGKSVGRSQSARPIRAGFTYVKPPISSRPSILGANTVGEALTCDGVSPLLRQLLESNHDSLQVVQRAYADKVFAPCQIDGAPYPITIPGSSPLEEYVESAHAYYLHLGQSQTREHLAHPLIQQLKRTLLAREVALNDLRQAADTAARAREFQLEAELILAYQHQIGPDAKTFEAFDYEGNPRTIKLQPHLTPQENADRLFKKARRAKDGSSIVQAQIERLEPDANSIRAVLTELENDLTLLRIKEIEALAKERRWLHQQTVAAKKEDRPFEGHAIREAHGPHGYRILYGDNSTSNDYLTHRLARPNDWWLHVRGGPSAHVVVQTMNQPDRVPKEVLQFAGLVAAKHSSSKHSSMVPVDFTLKKYVRKPRGGAPGLAVYTHEKTIHVDPKSDGSRP